MKEARSWLSSLSLENTQVLFVYGVGQGDYYLAAEEWLRQNPDHYLIFLDDDPEAIERLVKTKIGEKILQDPQAYLYPFESVTQEEGGIAAIPSSFFEMRAQVSALKGYAETRTKTFTRLKDFLHLCSVVHSFLPTEYSKMGTLFFRNFYRNLFFLPDAQVADALFGKFQGVPAIICGAGPSLDKNVAHLHHLKERALLFAGGSALSVLSAHQIHPHFGVGIDPNPAQMSRLMTYTGYTVPFIYRGRMNHEALQTVHGPLLYKTGASGYPIANYIEQKLGIEGAKIPAGFNVINHSVALAHAFGCSPIILVGVDLAYSRRRSYAVGMVSHPIYRMEQPQRTQERWIVKRDIHGEEVYTLGKWILEAVWFTEFAEKYPEASLINATEGGLGFLGVPNLTLDEVKEKYLQKSYDFATWIHGEMQLLQRPSGVTAEKIAEILQELQASMKRPISEEEVAYRAVLKVFDEFIQGVSKRRQEQLQSEVWQDKERLSFLQKVAKLNEMMLQEALLEQELKAKQPARSSRPRYVKIPEDRGPVVVRYPDGAVKMEHSSDGPSLFYAPDGEVLAYCHYEKGVKQGEAWFCDRSGALLSLQRFCDGRWDGEQEFYYPDGAKRALLSYQKGGAGWSG